MFECDEARCSESTGRICLRKPQIKRNDIHTTSQEEDGGLICTRQQKCNCPVRRDGRWRVRWASGWTPRQVSLGPQVPQSHFGARRDPDLRLRAQANVSRVVSTIEAEVGTYCV